MARRGTDNPFIAVMEESEAGSRPTPRVPFTFAQPEATATAPPGTSGPSPNNLLGGLVRGGANTLQGLVEAGRAAANLIQDIGNAPVTIPGRTSPAEAMGQIPPGMGGYGRAGAAVASAVAPFVATPEIKLGKMAIGPMLPIPVTQGVGQIASAGAPVQTENGPQPPSAYQVGERLGSGGTMLGLGASPLGWRFISREPIAGRPGLPAAGETAGAPSGLAGAARPGYRVVFTDQGPVYVPEGGPAATAPSQPPARPALPPASPGMTPTKVPTGFTPVMATYRVRLSEAGAKPGENAPFRDVEAMSPDEAVQKVKDELGQQALQYQFAAKPLKGTERPLTPGQTESAAAGTPRPAEQPRAIQAASKQATAAEGQPPSGKVFNMPPPGGLVQEGAAPPEATTTPKEVRAVPSGFKPLGESYVVRVALKGSGEFGAETTVKALTEQGALKAIRDKLGRNADKYDYQVELKPSEAESGAGAAKAMRKTTPPKEVTVRPSKGPAAPAQASQAAIPSPATEVSRSTPLPGERGAVGSPPAESAAEAIIGGRSKVVREPTTTEAAAMQPGETARGATGEIVHKIPAEAERRIAQRRGTGGGATSFGEERGPGAPERRAEPHGGRRAEDLAKLNEAIDEGNRRLVEIGQTKKYDALVTLYRKYNPKQEPPKGSTATSLREELTREARAMVQGAEQARRSTTAPKAGAAAEAALPPEGTSYYSGIDPEVFLKAAKPLIDKAGKKAKQVREWLLVPPSERGPEAPTLREELMRGELPARGDRLRKYIAQAHSAWTHAMILNWESRKFPQFHEQIDQFRVDSGRVQEKTTQLMADVIHPIVYRQDATGVFKRRSDAEQFALARNLNWVITVADLWGRAREGKLTPAHGFTPFAGLDPAQVTSILEGEMKTALIEAPGPVREAHKNWIALMKYAGEELKRRGALGTPRDWTYAPNIFRGDTWKDFAASQRIQRKPGEPSRSYVKRALGHLRKHDTNMIRAGVDHVHSVLMDNLSSDFAHSVGQAWDYSAQVWKQVEQSAKERGISMDKAMEEAKIGDFKLTGKDGKEVAIVPYRVGMARHLWKPESDIEFAIQKTLSEDPDFGLDFANLSEIRQYAGKGPGAKKVYLIPEPIANSLRQFREPLNSFDRLGYTVAVSANVWKAATLMSVYASYKTGNIIGDAFNLVVRTPSTVPLLNGLRILVGRTPKALIDIARAYGKEGPSKNVQMVDVVGGRQNVRATAEIGDLRSHKDLSVFYEPAGNKLTGPATAFGKAILAGLDRFLVADAVLEGAMRQASIEYLVEKGFPLKRAEQFTSHIIGDYRGVDRFTAMARRNWTFPFVVWVRQMVPGWSRWVTGLSFGKHFEGPGGQAFSPPNLERPSERPPRGTDPALWRMAHSGAYPKADMRALLVLASLQMLWWYWNSVVNKEQDDKVPDTIKMHHTYLINPAMKTTDGRPALLLDVVTPWDAVSGFFGTGNVPERIARLTKAAQSGKPEALASAVLSQIGETFSGPWQTVAGQAGPPFRVMGDLAELSARTYHEQLKPVEKQRLDRVRASAARSILKDTVPFSRMLPGVAPLKRQDLAGLPGWTIYALKGTPVGFVTVPATDAERRRQYSRGAPADATRLRPLGAGRLQQLRPAVSSTGG